MAKKKKGLCYISGPVTNDPDAAAKFERAEQILQRRGFDTFNPVKEVEKAGLSQATYEKIMAFLLKKLLTKCTEICMIPGWKKSKGASLEYCVAKETGMRTHFSI